MAERFLPKSGKKKHFLIYEFVIRSKSLKNAKILVLIQVFVIFNATQTEVFYRQTLAVIVKQQYKIENII
ncbi:hypothetical protein EAH81_06010 [Flavobacterium pectinovorum]|uniref:Uncharacterized protein n=1 Tax=Flavobacterium pectinovorum TaxID=29533 RepID=A0A502F5E2_9FLAO|nr:hypothetical protein EAH81_06010 [Flavobacterium pectinovorum]